MSTHATSVVALFLADHPGPFRKVRLRQRRFISLDPKWSCLLAAKGTEELALSIATSVGRQFTSLSAGVLPSSQTIAPSDTDGAGCSIAAEVSAWHPLLYRVHRVVASD
jgi:hypothetical protein